MSASRGGSERSGEYARAPLDFGLASPSRGELMDCALSGEVRERLEALSATLPELCGALDDACRQRISEQLESSAGVSAVELVLVSEEHVYVVRPFEKREDLALVSVSATTNSMGKILSDVHATVAELDTE
ncbi:MAG: hypothetical protein ACOY0T_28830 [Myxococcota bacterium]